MIGKSRRYRTLDFTDSVQVTSQYSNWYSYILQDVRKDIDLRTEVTERANYHWAYSTNTLASARLISFTWKVIWTNKQKRHTALETLMNILKPEWNPSNQNRWFYDLNFQTDSWEERTCSAKVYKMPAVTNWLDDPIIEFSFDLYSETEKIYSPTTQTVTWWRWFFWWIYLPIPTQTYLSWYTWYITVNNWWDWYAPFKINILWTCTNPQIINLTNNNKYRITWVTTNLTIDNTNLTNDPTKILSVTDWTVNIKSKRHSWAWLFLDPWVNHIILLTDVNSESPLVTINFRNTYIR